MFFMCGTDSTAVPLEIREQAALSETDIKLLTPKILEIAGIDACFILSTCNRTELYISGENADVQAAFDLILSEGKEYRTILCGEDVIRHLFETACGLNSLIKRETQIITQISGAEMLARKLGSLDAKLEVLLRLAITAAKKAADIADANAGLSSAQLAANWLSEQYGGLSGKKILVTGNGNVGRLAASLLQRAGADVTVTLRLRKSNVVPRGCRAIPYDERYDFKADAIFSATKSPHFTYTEDKMKHFPDYFIDLAVPRDISPKLRERCGKNYRCIDDFITETADNAEVLAVIDEGIEKYHEWETYRDSMPVIESIKETVTKRLCASDGYDESDIADIVGRTADMIFCGIKEKIDGESMQKCLDRLTERARL